ncbi:usg protein [Stappia taiwanensis]|uniref:Usg protein n=1 Tax=Stappia taiwanensis TaxID=992267 RepID=A0A838XJ22_9HYPH|nr:usg protein [Stappia taiwanensis]MBA4610535.1 usg protein [Stappia taiwanensis]GGE84118.1 Usg family protein [Stappia taiwanensis]
MKTSDFSRQLEGYGLLTAQILYHMPDHPDLLQSFLWQTFDKAPRFPELSRFLHFWQRDLDGKLHSVMVAHRDLIGPTDWRLLDAEFPIH